MKKSTLPHNNDLKAQVDSIYNHIVSICHPSRNQIGEAILPEVRRLLLDTLRNLLISPNFDITTFRQMVAERIVRETHSTQAGEEIYSKVLLQIRSWLEEEIILVYPRATEYLQHMKAQLQKGDPVYRLVDFGKGLPPRDSGYIDVDIDFKSEYAKRSKLYPSAGRLPADATISLVTQVMFLVCSSDRILYTLHDRSYAGSSNRSSKYSLITARLSTHDIQSVPNLQAFQQLCKSTLIRELQELDELGLPQPLANKYIRDALVSTKGTSPRNRFIGVYEGKNGMVLSTLFAIFVTVDEFNNELTGRGSYLVPVDEAVFSCLHTLNLLNDILDYNSCNYCTLKTMQECRLESQQKPCIIRDIHKVQSAIKLHEFPDVDKNVEYNSNIGQYYIPMYANSVIISINIADYGLLSYRIVGEVRLEIEGQIRGFLDNIVNASRGLSYQKEATPEGYIVVIQSNQEQQTHIAVIAYFLALHLTKEFAILKEAGYASAETRIGLHAAELIDTTGHLFLAGNGINQALDIANFAQRGQILCSLKFAVQFLSSIQNIDKQLSLDSEALGLMKVVSHQNNRFYLTRDSKNPQSKGMWSREQQKKMLEMLRLSTSTILRFLRDSLIPTCFEEYGLPFFDFGFFTNVSGIRQRIFNLGVFTDETKLHYGNETAPFSHIPFLYRNAQTTTDELDKLIDSFREAEHLTIYGYSNIRIMKSLYRLLSQESGYLAHLKTLKLIFSDFSQYVNLNEPKATRLAQADWIRGFLYAHKISQILVESRVNRKSTTSNCAKSYRSPSSRA